MTESAHDPMVATRYQVTAACTYTAAAHLCHRRQTARHLLLGPCAAAAVSQHLKTTSYLATPQWLSNKLDPAMKRLKVRWFIVRHMARRQLSRSAPATAATAAEVAAPAEVASAAPATKVAPATPAEVPAAAPARDEVAASPAATEVAATTAAPAAIAPAATLTAAAASERLSAAAHAMVRYVREVCAQV